MPREIRQLPLFPLAPPTPEEDAAIAALESLKALAVADALSPAATAHAAAPEVEYTQSSVRTPTPAVGDSGRAGAIVDRTYERCPDDPEVVVTLPCGHTERFQCFPSGLSDAQYIAEAEASKAQDDIQDAMPPGTRVTLRPLVDGQGRTRESFEGQVLTVLGYSPQGFALLDTGMGGKHPYPASVDRLICE